MEFGICTDSIVEYKKYNKDEDDDGLWIMDYKL